MAINDKVSDLTFDDLLEINSELLDKLRNIKRKCKETLKKLNRTETELDMLRYEKQFLEKELEIT